MSALTKSSAIILSAMDEYADKIKAMDKSAKDYSGGHVKVSTNDKYQVTLYFGYKNNNSQSIQFPINKDEATIWFESLELFTDEFVKKIKSKEAKIKAIDTSCSLSMDDFLKDDNTQEVKSEDEEQSSTDQNITKTDTVSIAKSPKSSVVGSKIEFQHSAQFYEEQEADNARKLQELEELL